MRYVLANDTSSENNPGCHFTVEVLRELANEAGYDYRGSIPVGFGKEEFAGVLTRSPAPTGMARGMLRKVMRMAYSPKEKAAWDYEPPSIEEENLKPAISRLSSKLFDKLNEADVLIVNAEGTLHHNKPGALALLAQIIIANSLGIPVILMNGTIQHMDSDLLRKALGKCHAIFVRERRTESYLEKLSIKSKVYPDLLWFCSKGSQGITTQVRTGCLLCPGVLSAEGQNAGWTPDDFTSLVRDCKSRYSRVGYIPIEGDNPKFASSFQSMGVELQNLDPSSYEAWEKALSGYQMVITGRYHILILGWKTNTYCVPLQSNTWKIEGLLEMVDAPQSPNRNLRLSGLLENSTQWRPSNNSIEGLKKYKGQLIKDLVEIRKGL